MGRARRFAALLLVPFGAAAQSIAVDPTPIVLHDKQQTVSVSVQRDGQPVPRAEIGYVRLFVHDNDYTRMFEIRRVDGGLRIGPTELLEAGRYTMKFAVRGQPVSVPVDAPLDREPDSLDARAAARGITVEDLRRELGMYTYSGRQTLNLTLAPEYYVGRIVAAEMVTSPSSAFEWKVNGSVADSGQGSHIFEYVLRSAGEYTFEYSESHPEFPGVSTTAKTVAVDEPPVELELERNRGVLLSAPDGYTGITWIVDGEFVSESRELQASFDTPGEHRVECIATGNTAIQNEAFRKITYLITIR